MVFSCFVWFCDRSRHACIHLNRFRYPVYFSIDRSSDSGSDVLTRCDCNQVTVTQEGFTRTEQLVCVYEQQQNQGRS